MQPTPTIQSTVIALAGGESGVTPPSDLAELARTAYVVAADSGLDLADELGLDVDLVIGDMDSVTDDALARAEADPSIEVSRHPAAKDATDLQLALDAAAARQPHRIIVIGGHGGRLDHLLGNLLLLADDRYAGFELTAHMGSAVVTVIRRRAAVTGVAGSYISLLPMHGGAVGVTTRGLTFPLNDESLPAGSTRGVSNTLAATDATIEVAAGILLAVQPDPTSTASTADSHPAP